MGIGNLVLLDLDVDGDDLVEGAADVVLDGLIDAVADVDVDAVAAGTLVDVNVNVDSTVDELDKPWSLTLLSPASRALMATGMAPCALLLWSTSSALMATGSLTLDAASLAERRGPAVGCCCTGGSPRLTGAPPASRAVFLT